jgi:hypothetical protein
MTPMRSLIVFVIATGFAAAQPAPAGGSASTQPAAQNASPAQTAPLEAEPGGNAAARQITIPADTEIPLQLKNAIDTKHARPGDGVYCQTTFPVVVDNIIVIPAGSYVKGEITRVQRAGRVSKRAQVLFNFKTIIFPTGYTVEMPGTLHGDPGSAHTRIADNEGTVKTDGHDKVKKLPEAGRDAAYGSVGGAIATGTANGARIGGGIGAAAGLAGILLTRGADVRIEPGAALAMRLQRPLVVDVTSTVSQTQTQVVPRETNKRLPVPSSGSRPK